MAYDHVIVRLFSAVFITTIAEFTIKDKLDQLKCLRFFFVRNGLRILPFIAYLVKMELFYQIFLISYHRGTVLFGKVYFVGENIYKITFRQIKSSRRFFNVYN